MIKAQCNEVLGKNLGCFVSTRSEHGQGEHKADIPEIKVNAYSTAG